TARTSRDLIVVAHQKMTEEWWENHRLEFQLYISEIVLNEASLGDPTAASKRVQALQGIELLDVSNEAILLSKKLIGPSVLPQKATEDALHIAIATIHKVDYLLTWNCKHIANAKMRLAIETVNEQCGYKTPIICTPEELIGE
ncbi:MAG: type II toxin-antitoxin system VapC family toxin, partial [Candidatus Parabeggiatoa sp.]|nr:type II toxin-antitoxin system VapC family toxin [Candidatus Parabeggiatoa sp.]